LLKIREHAKGNKIAVDMAEVEKIVEEHRIL